jgi:hypothetical protein
MGSSCLYLPMACKLLRLRGSLCRTMYPWDALLVYFLPWVVRAAQSPHGCTISPWQTLFPALTTSFYLHAIQWPLAGTWGLSDHPLVYNSHGPAHHPQLPHIKKGKKMNGLVFKRVGWISFRYKVFSSHPISVLFPVRTPSCRLLVSSGWMMLYWLYWLQHICFCERRLMSYHAPWIQHLALIVMKRNPPLRWRGKQRLVSSWVDCTLCCWNSDTYRLDLNLNYGEREGRNIVEYNRVLCFKSGILCNERSTCGGQSVWCHWRTNSRSIGCISSRT